jgi:uncharacterized integral membrane protein (TIGR00698 family)
VAIISFVTYWFLRGTWFKFSALLWAFIYAIIVTNVLPVLSGARFSPGVQFCSSRLLRLSVALLGLTISASVWVKLGGAGVLVVLLNVAFAFLFGGLFCRYILRLGGALSVLLAVGTSICGASAIAATGPAIRAKAEEMGISLAAITLFGLTAMFLYPAVFDIWLSPWLGDSPAAFGMWVGTGVHETAQVIAAASHVDGALGMAMTAKAIRIFMIGPMVFFGLIAYRRFAARAAGEEAFRLSIPWFAVVFVLFTLVYAGLEALPFGEGWVAFSKSYVKPTVTFLLAWAFAGVGVKVKLSDIRAMGAKAFLGGIAVAITAGGSALLLTKYLWLLLS